MSESVTMRDIQVRMSKLGHRVFRNNVGLFTTSRGTRVRTGLCPGSSDLIGWTACGRFLAIEVKSDDGRVTDEQAEFLNSVNRFGGIGFVAWSADDAEKFIKERLCHTS